jgi:hypothetical protein
MFCIALKYEFKKGEKKNLNYKIFTAFPGSQNDVLILSNFASEIIKKIRTI